MHRLIMTTCLLLLFTCPPVHSGDKPALDTEAARVSYSIGYQAAEDAMRHEAEVELPALLRGVLDAITGSTPLLGPDERQATLATISQPEDTSGVKQELPQLQKDQAFIAANAKKPGVMTLPSGLQYRVIQPGSGKKPGPEDSVTVHYTGSLVDGGEFDSSYDQGKPETYRVNEVIPGWTEALQLMPEGAIWELVIPPRLAFNKRGPLENRTLIYRLELLSVIHSKAQQSETGAISGNE